MAPLFPRSGPGEFGSPMSQVLLGCYDFPLRIPGHLFASLPRSTRSSLLRVSQFALPVGRRTFQARVIVRPATRTAGSLARGRERDLPGFQAIHPVPLPRSTTPAEPTTPRLLTVSSMLPPHFPRRRLQRLMNFGALSRGFGTCCLRFENDVATIPARLTSGWLARLCREGVDPLDRCKRFQITFPSSFSGFVLAQGKFHFEPPFTSFDHLVGAGEQHRQTIQPERLRGSRVCRARRLLGPLPNRLNDHTLSDRRHRMNSLFGFPLRRRSSWVLALEPVRRVAGGHRLASRKAVVVPRASIRMRFAIGSRRMIVAAAGLCMTAFFHRSGGDLRRSCRIRSNHSNARRHDRRAMRNVILVT